jgi:hypothetical protein
MFGCVSHWLCLLTHKHRAALLSTFPPFLVTNVVRQVVYDEAPKGNGTLVRQVLLVMEPDLLYIAGSPIYTVAADSLSGTLSFCAKLTLLTEDFATVVNFR